jgi:POT family proton-dependent oligopeptide transporter
VSDLHGRYQGRIGSTSTASITAQPDTSFFGQPKGLAYLAFTEAWERFSYYGMSALIVLYMVQSLLLPENIDGVAGMAGFRNFLESIFGPLSTQALASQIFGLYSGFVYFTPILGGLIADRLLGAKKTVLIGCGLMSAGHITMAFDESFLLALFLLVLGSGCLKGNIAAQVGHLYGPHEESRRTQGYSIFSTGINVGAVIGPIVCGALAQIYGWHFGFGFAGILMLVASITYLAGQRHFPDPPVVRDKNLPKEKLTSAEWRITLLVIVVMMLTMFHSMAYYQMFNAGLIWVSQHVETATPLGNIPIPWFNSIDALFSILCVPLLIGLWRWQQAKNMEPDELGKMGRGALICASSVALMALSANLAGDGKISPLLPFLAYAGVGIAFMWYWPPLLALVSREAPKSINAMMMGSAYLTLFGSNLMMGWFGGQYEALGPVTFWLINAGIALTGAIVIFALAPLLRKRLA